MSLLALAERERQPIEAGCRMGVCGADPVAVLDGGGCLSSPDEDELNTLRRLGFADNTRMACVARIQSGPVTVSLTPEPGNPEQNGVDRLRPVDRQRGRARERHRRRDRGRLRAPRPPGLRDPRGRQRVARAVQPDGHLPAGLRPVGHAGPVPAARAVVRRPPGRRLAEHHGQPDRPGVQAGVPRHRRHARLRPADPGHGQQQHGAPGGRVRPAGQLRAAQRGRRHADPGLRPGARLPRGRGGRRRPARPRGARTRCTSSGCG